MFHAIIFLLLLANTQAVELLDRRQVKQYLQRYGYLNHEIDVEAIGGRMLKLGIRKYQVTYGLPVTGRMDNRTLNLMMTPRCGVTDRGMRSSSRNQRSINGSDQSAYNLFPGNPKWGFGDLMYRYEVNEELPTGIDYEMAVGRAFRRWESICPFNFRQLPDYDFPEPDEVINEDIRIGWYSGDHGDGYPFDGRGKEVAHAASPPSGKMHFDAAENWVARQGFYVNDYELDLESAAVHEIGHLLGLAHSDVREAIMYPYTNYGEVKRDLQADDIQGLRALYSFCNFVNRDVKAVGGGQH